MEMVIHRASERGFAQHGWLKSAHSFSFANYYNPARLGFGLLRVLNDDLVAPGMGFPNHPHKDMEIISIPLKGGLTHQDSTGHTSVINAGDVQIMSAGAGIVHSEFNASTTSEVNFLQIWIYPRARGGEPRYQQAHFRPSLQPGGFQPIVQPVGAGISEKPIVGIQQDAFLSIGQAQKDQSLTYQLHQPDNGVYVFVIEGDLELAGHQLQARDAAGIQNTRTIQFNASSRSEILAIEVPMT
jgi:hypothetical protein